jgi:hypothetical protein
MKKQFSFFSILIMIIVGSCKPSARKIEVNQTKKDTDQSVKNEKDSTLKTSSIVDNAGTPGYDKEVINLVRNYLHSNFKTDLDKGIIDSLSRRYFIDLHDLNNDGQGEIFVGLAGPYFCGSGGCTIILLSNKGNLITRFTVARYPFFLADAKTDGWKDLIIYSNGKNRTVKFRSAKYPSNVSLQPVFNGTINSDLDKVLDLPKSDNTWLKF